MFKVAVIYLTLLSIWARIYIYTHTQTHQAYISHAVYYISDRRVVKEKKTEYLQLEEAALEIWLHLEVGKLIE